MKRIFNGRWIVLLVIVALSACTPGNSAPMAARVPPTAAAPTPIVTAPLAAFTDPFAYCASVQTIDKPDARYTGEVVPEAVIQGYLQAANLQNTTEPADMLKKSTFWRCMSGQVLVCNVGANLPCESKANTDQTPTQAMNDYCKDNPAGEFIPMSVTGHETVYDWSCVKSVPQVGKQLSPVDAAGYIANIWYTLTPGK